MKLVAYCEIDLLLPMAQSLKDKRNIIKSLQEKLRNRYNIAIAEMAHNDLWKNTTLGIVTLGNESRYLEKVLMKIIDYIVDFPEVEMINYSIDYY